MPKRKEQAISNQLFETVQQHQLWEGPSIPLSQRSSRSGRNAKHQITHPSIAFPITAIADSSQPFVPVEGTIFFQQSQAELIVPSSEDEVASTYGILPQGLWATETPVEVTEPSTLITQQANNIHVSSCPDSDTLLFETEGNPREDLDFFTTTHITIHDIGRNSLEIIDTVPVTTPYYLLSVMRQNERYYVPGRTLRPLDSASHPWEQPKQTFNLITTRDVAKAAVILQEVFRQEQDQQTDFDTFLATVAVHGSIVRGEDFSQRMKLRAYLRSRDVVAAEQDALRTQLRSKGSMTPLPSVSDTALRNLDVFCQEGVTELSVPVLAIVDQSYITTPFFIAHVSGEPDTFIPGRLLQHSHDLLTQEKQTFPMLAVPTSAGAHQLLQEIARQTSNGAIAVETISRYLGPGTVLSMEDASMLQAMLEAHTVPPANPLENIQAFQDQLLTVKEIDLTKAKRDLPLKEPVKTPYYIVHLVNGDEHYYVPAVLNDPQASPRSQGRYTLDMLQTQDFMSAVVCLQEIERQTANHMQYPTQISKFSTRAIIAVLDASREMPRTVSNDEEIRLGRILLNREHALEDTRKVREKIATERQRASLSERTLDFDPKKIIRVQRLYNMTEEEQATYVIPTLVTIIAFKPRREGKVFYKAGIVTERNPLTMRQKKIEYFLDDPNGASPKALITLDVDLAYAVITREILARGLKFEDLEPLSDIPAPKKAEKWKATEDDLAIEPLLAILKPDEIYMDPNEVSLEEAEQEGWPLLRRDFVTHTWWLEFSNQKHPGNVENLRTALEEEKWSDRTARDEWFNKTSFAQVPVLVKYANAGVCFYHAEKTEQRMEKAEQYDDPYLRRKAQGSMVLERRSQKLNDLFARVTTLETALRGYRRDYHEALALKVGQKSLYSSHVVTEEGRNAALQRQRRHLTITAREILQLNDTIEAKGGIPFKKLQAPLQSNDLIVMSGKPVFVKEKTGLDRASITTLDYTQARGGVPKEQKSGIIYFSRILLSASEVAEELKTKTLLMIQYEWQEKLQLERDQRKQASQK